MFGRFSIKKNTHTLGEKAIAIDEREISRIIGFTHYQFFFEDSQEWKTISYRDLYLGNSMLTSFFSFGDHSKCLAQFFNVIICVNCNSKTQ